MEHISRISEGLTRRVNIIADKALLAAFADGTHNVTLKHVKAAVRDTEFADAPPATRGIPWGYIIPGALIGGAIGMVGLIAYQQLYQNQTEYQNVYAGNYNDRRASTPAAPAPANSLQSQQPVEVQAPAADLNTPADNEALPAAPAMPATATVISSEPEGVLEQRLRKTAQWLAESEGNRVTIQLLGSFNAKLLENDLRMIGKLIDPDRVFVYRTVAGSKPAYTVVFGSYRTRSEATLAIEDLPAALKTNGPYYRTVRSIRAEIARNSG